VDNLEVAWGDLYSGVIFVKHGWYKFDSSVIINQTASGSENRDVIRMVGEERLTTRLEPQGNFPVFKLYGGISFVFEHLKFYVNSTFSPSYTSYFIYGETFAEWVTVQDCFFNRGNGIFLASGSTCIITNNVFERVKTSVRLVPYGGLTSPSGAGQKIIITNNHFMVIKENATCINMTGTSSPQYYRQYDLICDNLFSKESGVSNVTLIRLYFAQRLKIEGNMMVGAEYGIREISNCFLNAYSDNFFYYVTNPITFSGGSTSEINNNFGFTNEKTVSFSGISNGSYVAHGLYTTPDETVITLSVWGYAWYGTRNSTHVQI